MQAKLNNRSSIKVKYIGGLRNFATSHEGREQKI